LVFKAGASDFEDGTTPAIRWYLQDPNYLVLDPDFAECNFSPSGRLARPGFPYLCPWRPLDDSGAGFTWTYHTPGTWGVMVFAKDSQGAISKREFYVTI